VFRLKKIGQVQPKSAAEVMTSRIGIGFEKLDRAVFDPEKAYDKVAAIGVKWVRIQSGWARTEKEKGVYDFSWLDSIVDNLISRGLKPWICLCYGNGLYDEFAATIFGAVGCPPIHTEEQRTAWKNYVTALVERYKDRVMYYEIWNEPDGQYCWKHGVNPEEVGKFNEDTGKYIKSVYPEAQVIGGCVCRRVASFINEAFDKSNMAEYIDAISFHEYTHDETTVPERVEMLHAIADKYKPGIRIIQGESGSQSRTGGAGAVRNLFWSEKAQAKQCARHTMIDLMSDIEFTSFFTTVDMIEALRGKVDDKASYLDYGYFGVLGAQFDEDGFSTGEYIPKPSYYTLQTIASVFVGDALPKKAPVIFRPEFCPGTQLNDLKRTEVISGYFEREDGSSAFVYWKPDNIITTDYNGTVTFEIVGNAEETMLIDLVSGEIYEIPGSQIENLKSGCRLFKHIPVKETPLALCIGNFYR